MKISKSNSVCMSVDQIRRRIVHGKYPSMCSLVKPTGIVVYLGTCCKNDDDEIFLSLSHSRPLSDLTYRVLVHEAKKTDIRIF